MICASGCCCLHAIGENPVYQRLELLQVPADFEHAAHCLSACAPSHKNAMYHATCDASTMLNVTYLSSLPELHELCTNQNKPDCLHTELSTDASLGLSGYCKQLQPSHRTSCRLLGKATMSLPSGRHLVFIYFFCFGLLTS